MKKKGKRPKREPKNVELRQKTFCTLREGGLTLEKAGKLSGYSPGSISYLSRHVEQKRKRGLLSPFVPMAKKALKSILKGEQVGDAEMPKASDVLRAAEMVMDREEPKTQRIDQRNISVSYDLTDEMREELMRELMEEARRMGDIPAIQEVERLLPAPGETEDKGGGS